MNEILKKISLKFPPLYIIGRCFQNIGYKQFYNLIRTYFEWDNDKMLLELDNAERLEESRPIFNIIFSDNANDRPGLFGLLYKTLDSLIFTDNTGFIPVVIWGNQSLYYDFEMDKETTNVFEYYFLPIGEKISATDCPSIKKCGRYGIFKPFGFYEKETDELFVSKYAEAFKRHIHLNNRTKDYIVEELSKIFVGQKVLGVHVRGTDFNCGIFDHPKAVPCEEYLKKVKEYLNDKKYNSIFLATDDSNVVETFKSEFKDNVICFSDTFRSDCDIGPHAMSCDRPFHHYKLGLEVLRDVYALACCDGLICGISNVSFAVRYINIALGRKFDDITILNNGINEKNLSRTKEFLKKNNKNT